MSSVIEALASGGMSFVQAALVYKLFGPYATHIGNQLPGMSDRAAENFWKVVYAARDKLGEKLEQPGQIPPRVMRGAVNEAPYCEDSVAVEYVGGVLASSKHGDEDEEWVDDRGVSLNALIARLSSYQIRTHYIVYKAIHDLYQGTNQSYDDERGVVIPFVTYLAALTNANIPKSVTLAAVIHHTFDGLYREDLISSFDLQGKQVRVTPAAFGIELFMWANGHGAFPVGRFLDRTLKFPSIEGIFLPEFDCIIRDDETTLGQTLKTYTYYPSTSLTCPVLDEFPLAEESPPLKD